MVVNYLLFSGGSLVDSLDSLMTSNFCNFSELETNARTMIVHYYVVYEINFPCKLVISPINGTLANYPLSSSEIHVMVVFLCTHIALY